MQDTRYAATIGFFDGVHTGHRYVLRQLLRVAEENGLKPLVVTFREHPRKVLQGEQTENLKLLTSPEERLALLRKEGVEILMLDFAAIRHLTAGQFMQWLHQEKGVDILCMGYDHRFGSDGLRTFEDYAEEGRRVGIKLLHFDKVQLPANEDASLPSKISSTVCRRLLEAGKVEDVNRLLGYAYTLSGVVEHGRAIGRTIGFPTANLILDFPEKQLPAYGVYAAQVGIEEGADSTASDGNIWRKALVNIGNNPTVGAEKCSIEVHIVDYAGNLYGKHLSVRLLRYMREERTFASLEQLQQQIEKDVDSL